MTDAKPDKPQGNAEKKPLLKKVYDLLARRPWTVILMSGLAYNIVSKFIWACRLQLKGEFHLWILSDIAALLAIDLIFSLICNRWSKPWAIRLISFIAGLICAWSVMNAGWMMRTGTQILPNVLLPLFRAPVNSFQIVGYGLTHFPAEAVVILGTSTVLLTFFFSIIATPRLPNYNRLRFMIRAILTIAVILGSGTARITTRSSDKGETVAAGLKSNCQLRALVSFFRKTPDRLTDEDFANAKRTIPLAAELNLYKNGAAENFNKNVVIIVLEGVQYKYTSLADPQTDRTPFLRSLAAEGIELSNARCVVTHTTKALFSLLTGRLPSISQDIAEAVPADKPYASLATILKNSFGHRSAFFQSAKGNFEGRPGLVHNLGYDKFWARDNCPDANAYVGYLGCDEFAMLAPIVEWVESDNTRPFFLTVLCSVTHDPYDIPQWYAEPAEELIDKYFQTIEYTDHFISALNIELEKLGLTEETIFCVVGDHGEAFGEHGLWTHERIAFEEALRIVMVMRCPGLLSGPVKITQSANSLDFIPTLLGIIGLDVEAGGFSGLDILNNPPADRKVYFSGWLSQSPFGYVRGQRKFVYDPQSQTTFYYDLASDPLESRHIPLSEHLEKTLLAELSDWRRSSLYLIARPNGRAWLYENWKCRWNDRVASAKFKPAKQN